MSRKEPNQNYEMKIADSFLLSLFMTQNEKCSISLSEAPYSIHNTKSIGVIDPEGPDMTKI